MDFRHIPALPEYRPEYRGKAPVSQVGDNRPVKLTLHITQIKPKSRNDNHPTGKPDADNQIKLCGDALNKIVWADDSQIVAIDYGRFYGASDRVFIRVEELV